MDDVNAGLLTLAFVLGLALTFTLMVRRVQPEVPVNPPDGPAPTGGAAGFAGGRSGAESEPAPTPPDADGQ